MRVDQKSAEAVVVMKLTERSEERRAEVWNPQFVSSAKGRGCRNLDGVATAAATSRAGGRWTGWNLV